MNGVPFRLRYLPGNLARVEGIAWLDCDAVVLEFRIADALFGILRSRSKEVRISLADVEAVELRKGWFVDKLCILTRRASVLDDLPWACGPEMKLKCRRRHRLAARALAATLRLQATEKRLEVLRGAPQQADEADEAPLERGRGSVIGRASGRSSS